MRANHMASEQAQPKVQQLQIIKVLFFFYLLNIMHSFIHWAIFIEHLNAPGTSTEVL